MNVGGLEAGATWQYSTDDGTNWTTGSGSSFTLAATAPRSVIVRQTDAAGNASSNSSASSFTLDTTADGGGDLALSISDTSINNAEKGAVAFTTSGIDGDVSQRDGDVQRRHPQRDGRRLGRRGRPVGPRLTAR